jgi:uncharacterized protein
VCAEPSVNRQGRLVGSQTQKLFLAGEDFDQQVVNTLPLAEWGRLDRVAPSGDRNHVPCDMMNERRAAPFAHSEDFDDREKNGLPGPKQFSGGEVHLGQGLFLFFAGAIAGTLNAVAGGGTFVSFPALLTTGVPPIEANATNTVALWPGLAASTGAYFKRLDVPRRLLVPWLLTSAIGGFAGSFLLLATPQQVFLRLIPWLLLVGTLLFAFGNQIRALGGRTAVVENWRHASWQVITVASFIELLIGIYGGYFGAGIGFITLGMLAALGMSDIHAMGAIRTLLAAVINAAAVLLFVVARAVLWSQCMVMVAGAVTGGWFGAHFAQRTDPARIRRLVIAIGLAMTAYYFVKAR